MIRMRIEGGEQLARNLQKLSQRVSKNMLRNALRTIAAEPICRRASAMAPRAPGAPDLAANIVVSTGTARGLSASVVVGPSTASRADQPTRTFDRQGLYVEYGTSDTVAQPFLRPAFDSEAPRTIGAFAGEVWSALVRSGISARGSGFSGGGLL